MTSVVEADPPVVARSTETGARIQALQAAARAAAGRLDDDLVAEAGAVAERAAGRLRLSSDHTVVAIAGATGSGKSSTFNALTGLELSAVGVRRPTTSWATACVWGSQGAEELLEWLGIPSRHQTTRDSMLDTRREDRSLDGVVLLDLPDHDSTEVNHHLEVDRLVGLADLLVWVLDPQKYADAAIHDRYLEPLRTHDEVMLVVLNHIDTVPADRRQVMLDDLRRILDGEGLAKVPVLPVSAREGIGIDELRAEIARRVERKRMTRTRLEADVTAVATRMSELTGDAPTRTLPETRVEALEEAVSESGGVPTVVRAVERATRLRVRRATGWPPLSWVPLRPDPVKRLGLDLGSAAAQLGGRSTAVPDAGSVERSRVDSEVRALADEVSAGMTTPWRTAVHRAAVGNLDALGDRLDAALAATNLGADRLPVWAWGLRFLQWLLLLGALGGAVWFGLGRAGAVAEPPSVGDYDAGLLLLAGCLLLGLVLAVVCRPLASLAAKSRAERARARLREAVSSVTSELVVGPVEAELEAYTTVRTSLERALR